MCNTVRGRVSITICSELLCRSVELFGIFLLGRSGKTTTLTELNGTVAITAAEYTNDMNCSWFIKPNTTGVTCS